MSDRHRPFWPLALFLLTAAAQLAVPLHLAWSAEHTLATGQAVKLRTAPVDPYDPMRGRYVALDYDWPSFAPPPGFTARPGTTQTLYAVLAVDADGFGTVTRVQVEPPADGELAFAVPARLLWTDEVRLQPSFDALYLNEAEAPLAEARYLELNRPPRSADGDDAADPSPETYAVIRVRGHQALLEGVYVDGVPLRDWALNQAPAR